MSDTALFSSAMRTRSAVGRVRIG